MVTIKKNYVNIQKCIRKQEEQKLTKVKFVSIAFVLLFVGFSISNLSMADTKDLGAIGTRAARLWAGSGARDGGP